MNERAPEGTIFVCAYCGKTARWRYCAANGWDESCMLHAVLCHEQKGLDGKWRAVAACRAATSAEPK
jgi:hypothetical protein